MHSNPDFFALLRTKYPVWHLQMQVCIFYVKVRLMWFKWEARFRICGAKELDFIISTGVNVHTAWKTSTGANNWARWIRFCRAGFAGRILLMLLSGPCWFCSPQITFVAERILSKILSESNRFPWADHTDFSERMLPILLGGSCWFHWAEHSLVSARILPIAENTFIADWSLSIILSGSYKLPRADLNESAQRILPNLLSGSCWFSWLEQTSAAELILRILLGWSCWFWILGLADSLNGSYRLFWVYVADSLLQSFLVLLNESDRLCRANITNSAEFILLGQLRADVSDCMVLIS